MICRFCSKRNIPEKIREQIEQWERKYDCRIIVENFNLHAHSRDAVELPPCGAIKVVDLTTGEVSYKMPPDPIDELFGIGWLGHSDDLIMLRFYYYTTVLRLPRSLAIKRLVNCDFFLSERKIEKVISVQKARFEKDINLLYSFKDATYFLLAFDWSKRGKRARYLKENIPEYKSAEERYKALKRIKTAYYYFYVDCLAYPEDIARRVIEGRDFPEYNQNNNCKIGLSLQDALEEHAEYLHFLRRDKVTPKQLRNWYPAYAWDERQNYLIPKESGIFEPTSVTELYDAKEYDLTNWD